MNRLDKKDYRKYDYWFWENFFNKKEVKQFNKERNFKKCRYSYC